MNQIIDKEKQNLDMIVQFQKTFYDINNREPLDSEIVDNLKAPNESYYKRKVTQNSVQKMHPIPMFLSVPLGYKKQKPNRHPCSPHPPTMCLVKAVSSQRTKVERALA